MSPRTGRPTDDPKNYRVSYRLSKEDIDKINECCEKLGISATEVIRGGIQAVHATLSENK